MTAEAPKRALTGGEIDPDLWYASDLNPVRVGASSILNFIVRQRGGIERTPGTEHLAVAKTSARVRLATFKRSSDTSYILEYGPDYVRAHDADMLSGAAMIDEVVTPYGADILPFLQWAQSNDVMWIFSGQKVKELRRAVAGGVSFDLFPAIIEYGPFLDMNTDEASTITASAVTGAITLTASAAIFEAAHVGSIWRLEEGDTGVAELWTPEAVVTAGLERRFANRTYLVSTGGTTTVYPPEHERGARDDGGGVVWDYLHAGFGVVEITGFTSATQVSATVVKRLPAQIVAGTTWRWQEGAFSDLRGYPVTGALYKNALWMAGTDFQPYEVWKSAIDGFNDFEAGVLDDSSLSRGLIDGATEAVRWLCPSAVLVAGTDGPEWVARPETTGDTVRTKNLITEAATNEGSSFVPGIAVSGVTIFTDASNSRLVGLSYDLRKDGWQARELSLLAAHMLGPGVIETAYQRNPWPVLWCLLADGTLAALTYMPDQDVLAWHRHSFSDPVESIAVSSVESGRRETLFLAVRRGAEVHIERMFDRYRPERGQTGSDARYTDAAKTYDLEEAALVFAGLDHLEGREVIALVDGNSHPPVVVTGGAVTLNFAGRKVIIGLRKTSRYKTLPFDMGMPDLAHTPRNKRLSDLAIAFSATMGGSVRIADRIEDVFRLGASPLDAAPALFSGIKRVSPPGSENSGGFEYVNDTAWPATVTAIFPEYEV